MGLKDYSQHPDFGEATRAANEGLRRASLDMGYHPSSLDNFEAHCNRVLEDLTWLLLRVADDARKVT